MSERASECVECENEQLIIRPEGRRVEISTPGLFLFLVVSKSDTHASRRAKKGMKDDLSFSTIAHGDKQISLQISTIVFSNALLETLLIKLGDSILKCSSGVTELSY